MLQKISNKYCSFDFSIHQRISFFYMISIKILSSTTFNIDDKKESTY